uniref:Uncharacterized protein n=1 Tax=Anguilla anguilla TaxID=7936 RepID=A0A0E9P6X6_ANGAN
MCQTQGCCLAISLRAALRLLC